MAGTDGSTAGWDGRLDIDGGERMVRRQWPGTDGCASTAGNELLRIDAGNGRLEIDGG